VTAEFRDQLATFLDGHHPGKRPGSRRDRIEWQRSWSATLFDNGFAGPSWPRVYGGMDLPFGSQVAYYDELARRRLPGHPGNGPSIAGPTIIRHGTDEQRRRYLPAMLRGDQIWAQGFSEPEAGSDLPALRTLARRDGDEYVVTGQKVWSSYADVADMMFALVRTGRQEDGAKGISYLLVDLRAPGVTVRPLRDISGGQQFCEVFLDEVRVPVANRVGAENGGWPIARTTLGHERAARSLSQAANYRRRFGGLLELMTERGVTADPLARDRLAELAVRVRILRLNALRSTASLAATGEAEPAPSVTRLSFALLEQQLYELAVDLLGPDALVAGPTSGWVKGLLTTRGSTIGAGTAEIQRNTIAEQVLGLPREPSAGV
jgi:alkylation response protein AidB-like acyl-CoA dehydrogenase